MEMVYDRSVMDNIIVDIITPLWMVFVRETPIYKWMIPRATSISGTVSNGRLQVPSDQRGQPFQLLERISRGLSSAMDEGFLLTNIIQYSYDRFLCIYIYVLPYIYVFPVYPQ